MAKPVSDPKLIGAPILRRTLCRVGTHAWLYASSGRIKELPAELKCQCGAYTWQEWKGVPLYADHQG